MFDVILDNECKSASFAAICWSVLCDDLVSIRWLQLIGKAYLLYRRNFVVSCCHVMECFALFKSETVCAELKYS